jgi:hypothetical protein
VAIFCFIRRGKMGCDIHFYVEKWDKDKWIEADDWRPSDDEWEGGRPTVKYGGHFYDGRNYSLFAILANVRNGYGFAGVDTGDGFVPMDMPRGLPKDVTPKVKAEAEAWEGDGHSHSWFLLKELLEYDWTQTTKRRGWVSALEFSKWIILSREEGELPDLFSGGVSGPDIKHIALEEMEVKIQKLQEEAGQSWWANRGQIIQREMPDTYAQFEMEQPYYKTCRSFLSDTIPRLLRLGKPEDVRVVFWFDN